MDYKNIDRWSFMYWLYQRYVIPAYNVYYRRISIHNKKAVPHGHPCIYAPNHQNALMDAMPFVCMSGFQPVFMARADIFKKESTAKILRFLKIMPVFRIRDGFDQLKRNDETFNIALSVLEHRQAPLIIMAEGSHNDKHSLKPLVKGIFRIAFQAQSKYGETPCVKILPVGLEFGSYFNARTTLLINYGEPIEVSEYMQQYALNAAHGIQALKDRLEREMKSVMIHIDDDEYYETYMHVRAMYNTPIRFALGIGNSLYDRFTADKQIIGMLDRLKSNDIRLLDEIKEKTTRYFQMLGELNLRDWVLRKSGYSIVSLFLQMLVYILFAPVFIYGFILNALPYRSPLLIEKKVQDKQFLSSVRFAVGMITYFFWLLILSTIIALLPCSLLVKLMFIASIPLSGVLAFSYHIALKKFFAQIRFMSLKWKKSSLLHEAINLRASIIDILNTLRKNELQK